MSLLWVLGYYMVVLPLLGIMLVPGNEWPRWSPVPLVLCMATGLTLLATGWSA